MRISIHDSNNLSNYVATIGDVTTMEAVEIAEQIGWKSIVLVWFNIQNYGCGPFMNPTNLEGDKDNVIS